jgi:hypothetical protein
MSTGRPSGLAILVGFFTIIGVLVALATALVKLYFFVDSKHEQQVSSYVRDLAIVLQLESTNQGLDNFYSKAKEGKIDGVTEEEAEEQLERLAYDREKIQTLKFNMTGEMPED